MPNWDEHLSAIEYSWNSTINRAIGYAPIQVLLGFKPINAIELSLANQEIIDELPEQEDMTSFLKTQNEIFDKMSKDIKENHRLKYDKTRIKYYDKHRKEHKFNVGDLVLHRNRQNKKLDNPFTGPWRVMQQMSTNTVKAKLIRNGFIQQLNVSQLKLFQQE